MDKKIIKALLADLEKSGTSSFTQDFKHGDTLYSLRIEKRKRNFSFESYDQTMAFNRAESISALPSGNQCGCCGGSGRS